MLDHHLRVAARQLRRAPVSALLNVVTLALGLACFVAASTIVGFWNRAEEHFANAERIYLVTGVSWAGIGIPLTSALVAEQLAIDFPEIEAVARVAALREPIDASAAGRAARLNAHGGDAEFLRIFDLPFTAGDARNALSQPGSVILTQAAARNLYGREDVLGQPLVLGDAHAAIVTGVIGEIPEPSHMGRSASAVLQLEMLVSRDLYEALATGRRGPGGAQRAGSWTAQTDFTYVQLPADGSLPAGRLREELEAFVARHAPADELAAGGRELELDLMPITELLGASASDVVFLREAGVSAPAVLLGLGSLVLLIACLNYANLATARAVLRGRDVGVRRTLGAARAQIAAQYLLDAAVHAAAALLLAVLAVRAISPLLEAQLGIEVGSAMLADFRSYVQLIAVLVVVTLMAGAYPAFLLSRVEPVAAIRSRMSPLGPRAFAKTLIAVQFATASFLLIAVTVIFLQHRAIESAVRQSADPLLLIDNDARRTGVSQETLRGELLRLPQVRAATTISFHPWQGQAGSPPPLSRTPDRSTPPRPVRMYGVGSGFFSTMEIPVLAGGALDAAPEEGRVPTGGRDQRPRLIVDRSLTEQLGFRSPDEAVGATLYMLWDQYEPGEPATPVEVIGVVDDRSLNVATGLGPASSVYGVSATLLPVHLVRISAADVAGALTAIESLWQRLAPSVPLERRFESDDFEASFATYSRIGQVFVTFALIAFLIASFGLLAMALLLVNRRVQEIAVRKTLGAQRGQLVWMLLTWLSQPILIANFVALPFALAFALAYVRVFDQPIALTPSPFLACLAFTLVLASATVGREAWRAASIKPADVLRRD